MRTIKKIMFAGLAAGVALFCAACQLSGRESGTVVRDNEESVKNKKKESAPKLKDKWPAEWAETRKEKQGEVQKIDIIRADGEISYTLTANEDVFSFIHYLDMEHWNYDDKALPDSSKLVCDIVYYEQKPKYVTYRETFRQKLYKDDADYYIVSSGESPMAGVLHVLDEADGIPKAAGDFVSELAE